MNIVKGNIYIFQCILAQKRPTERDLSIDLIIQIMLTRNHKFVWICCWLEEAQINCSWWYFVRGICKTTFFGRRSRIG